MAALPIYDLRGEVAVVTGASSGIGRRLALGLAEAGARVVALARRRNALDEIASDAVRPHAADLASVEDWDALAGDLAAPHGAPSILVNAAGVNHRQAADEVTAEGWASTLHLNLTVPFMLARALVARMTGAGSLLNVASLQSERAFPNSIAYGASKGGVAQLTRAMAEAWGTRGVRANAIAPGFFPTELTAPVFGDAERTERLAAQTCLGRNGELDDLVGPAVFLCSGAARYVTGQVLYVDGGFTAK